MHIQEHVSLAKHSTMRLGGPAAFFAVAKSKSDIAQATAWAEARQLPLFMWGGGSNVIVRDDGFAGLVVANQLKEFTTLRIGADSTTLRIGAGEIWDDVVAKTVAMGLSGIECLSLIPGTAGATPVQNVGAYGQEIAQTLVELEAYDMHTHQFVTLSNADCQFTYRHSIFKDVPGRRYIICNITLQLSKALPQPPFYASLQRYLDEHGVTHYTPKVLRQAVIAIRRRILPDPKVVANTGSFFKNPLVEPALAARLLQQHPDMPHYDMPNGQIKIPAGWLIDRAGLKGYAAHGLRTYDHNALVVVNERAQNYHDLAQFRDEIIAKVHATFGVTLQQEPELL